MPGGGDLINATELYYTSPDGTMYLNVNALLSSDFLSSLFCTDNKQTTLSATAGDKKSHTFTDGTKKFTIRSEKVTEIEYNFNESDFDSSTNNLTVTSGGRLKWEGLFLTGKTIYFKTDKDVTVEIEEWY